MRNETLLGKAFANLQVADAVLKLNPDDAVINIAAYHIQQAVELSLKHALEYCGVRYPKTHAIEDLVELLPSDANDIVEYVGESSYMFSSWEAKTRYVKGFHVSLKAVERGLVRASEILDSVAIYCGNKQGAQVKTFRLE